MNKWLRTAVLILVIALVSVATQAYAYWNYAFWVPVQTNSPSNGTVLTWGNYWGGVAIMFTKQTFASTPLTTYQYQLWGEIYGNVYPLAMTNQYSVNAYSSVSGAASWIGLSRALSLGGYVYEGVVGSSTNVNIGSNYTFSSGYQYFVTVGVLDVSSETCGQLYFHADVKNTASSTASFNAVYVLDNNTWAYVEFYSSTVPSNSWFNPAVAGPSTCLSPGYYVYIATIAVNVSEYTVGTAQVSIGTTSEGTSYTPGTQYAWGTPGSNNYITVPWTTYANPYPIIVSIQQSVNTGGSPISGNFYVALNNINEFAYISNAYYLIYTGWNVTGFPGGVVSGYNCPSNVYELPASINPGVTKIMPCTALTAPSSGIAVYPTDYGRYGGPYTYTVYSGYLLTVSYTDSGGYTYTWQDYFTQTTQVSIYINKAYYTASTRQVSFPLSTNLTLFAMSTYNMQSIDLAYPRFGLEFPANCYVSTNPYVSGATGYTSLPSCTAINYGAMSIVVWLYEPSGGYGPVIDQGTTGNLVLVPFQPSGNTYSPSASYIASYAIGGADFVTQVSLSPGWHMFVFETYYVGGTNPFEIAVYMDNGTFIGSDQYGSDTFFTSMAPTYLGFGYTYLYVFSQYNYYLYNGTIAYVAIYNTVLNSSQVQQLYSVGFPNSLFGNNLVVAYVLSNTTYYVFDGVSHFYIKPYFANSQILSQLGISNASLITITPTGQVGWVPFTQWQQVTNYSVISYCKLMSYYTFNYLGGSEYQVVLVTNQNMNQFPLNYKFLITSGSGSQYVLPVLAYGNTNTYTNTTTATPSASAFLPICDAPPSTVPVAIETTAVTPMCNGNNVGYTTTNLEKLPNGTTYTYTLTYVLGQNATTMPPALVPGYIQAYPYALMLVVLLIIAIVMYRFGDLGMRGSLILAGATAVVTVLAYLGVGNPYASFNLSCPNANAPVTVTVPLPQNLFLATTWLGIIAIILVIASLITEYSLY